MENNSYRNDALITLVVLLGISLWLREKLKGFFQKPVHIAGPYSPFSFAPILYLLLHVLIYSLGAAVVLVAGIAAVRWWMRLRRIENMKIDEIILGPDDTATPYEVMSALDAIHGQLLTRYVPGVLGQNSWTFEIVRLSDGSVHFLIGAPFEWLKVIEDVWQSKYTNIRFRPWSDRKRNWRYVQQIVLTKHWRHATETQKDFKNSVVETIVQSLNSAQGEVHLQYLMTPVPAAEVHEELRQHIRSIEREARTEHVVDPANPGVGYAEKQMINDVLQLYGKAVFRTEIRLAADNWQTIQRVYGAIHEAQGENKFRAATVLFGKRLWIQWFYQRVPSLSMFRANLMFSFPLASLIHLPSARLRVTYLQRMLIRRGPVPMEIPNEDELAIMVDAETETRKVGILEADRKYNILLLGTQGSGKSTDILNVFRVDVSANKAVVLVDIGKDTAKYALGIAPDEREVIWFDPSDPNCPWTVNPLAVSSRDYDSLTNHVLDQLSEVFGEQAIGPRSRQFLGNAIMAVREVYRDKADFEMVYRMFTDEEFRNNVIQHIRSEQLKRYWHGEFMSVLAANPRFLEEALSAPRNKLDEVLREPLIRAAMARAGKRALINFHDVVAGRKVFIANLDKAVLGDTGARLLGVFLVTLLWQAAQAQSMLPERSRVPISLIIDEAQNFISPKFLSILAEGRAFGMQVTAAVRFIGEIVEERVAQGLQNLCQNLIVHQVEELEEAESLMKRFMRVWANMVTTSDESQDALNFGADDFLRLPKFYAICRFMVNGTPKQAFLAKTLPWTPFYSEARANQHLKRQGLLAGQGNVEQVEQRPVMDKRIQEEKAPETSNVRSVPQAAWDDLQVVRLLLGTEVQARIAAMTRDIRTGFFTKTFFDEFLVPHLPDQYMVLMIDLDGLHDINNRQGHAAGDAYISAAAEAIKKIVRSEDILVRWGGDEFLVVMPGMVPDAAKAFGHRLRKAFQEVGVSASMGAAFHNPGEDFVDVFQRADDKEREDKERRKLGRDHRKNDVSVERAPYGSFALAFCQKYGISVDDLKKMQHEAEATESEVDETAQWVLKKSIPASAVRARFRKVLVMKVTDRKLEPIAERLGCKVEDLRKAAASYKVPIEQFIKVADEHQEAKTIDEIASHISGNSVSSSS